MTSLGYRRGCDRNSARPGEIPVRATTTITVASPAVADTSKSDVCTSSFIPKGFLPLLFYSSLFMIAPLMIDYVDFDFSDSGTRASFIAVSGVYALIVVLANDCLVWFNMVLFFHIGLEVRTSEILMDFARLDTTSSGDEILAWTGMVVLIVHLVPFLLVDNTTLLTVLAFAGIIVNTSIVVYLASDRLLLVGFSSTTLLGSTLCISGVCEIATSMLTALRTTLQDGTWLKCSTYLM